MLAAMHLVRMKDMTGSVQLPPATSACQKGDAPDSARDFQLKPINPEIGLDTKLVLS